MMGMMMTKTNRTHWIDISKAIRPPKYVSLREYADKNRRLPTNSSVGGRWDTKFIPAAVEIYDTYSNPNVRQLTIKGPTQLLKTEFLLNIIFFHVEVAPTTMKFVLPDEDKAKTMSIERIEKAADLMPFHQHFLGGGKKRKGKTSLKKPFVGGYLDVVSADSASALISDPVKIILLDEFAIYKKDVMGKVRSRQTWFPDAKTVAVSSPQIKGKCPITREYDNGHRAIWELQCVHCSEHFNPTFECLKWEDKNPSTALLYCPHCGTGMNDEEKAIANENGRWVSEFELETHASFTLNVFANPMISLKLIATEYIEAVKFYRDTHDKAQLRDFYTDRMALAYEGDEGVIEPDEVKSKLTILNHDEGVVDNKICFMTCAVDVQMNHMEAEIRGWYPFRSKTTGKLLFASHGVEYKIITGNREQENSDAWMELLKFYSQTFTLENYPTIKVRPTIMFIDTGHDTNRVAQFTNANLHKGIYPIKGQGASAKGNDPSLWQLSNVRETQEKYSGRFVNVGTNLTKSRFFGMMWASLSPKEGETSPFLFPRAGSRGYDDDYYKKLMSEKRIVKPNGKYAYEKINKEAPNEALDIMSYGIAAMLAGGQLPTRYKDTSRVAKGGSEFMEHTQAAYEQAKKEYDKNH